MIMVTAPAIPVKTSSFPVTVLGWTTTVEFELGVAVGAVYIGGIWVGFSVGDGVCSAVG